MPNTLFDTHFHYSGNPPPTEFMAGVQTVLKEVCAERNWPEVPQLRLAAMGGSVAESRLARQFSANVPGSVFAVGVHPHQATEFSGDAAEFAEFRHDPQLAAIGEIGLDYYYDCAPRERQRQVFAQFLELALAWGLPACIHLRDAADAETVYADALAVLRDYAQAGGTGVIHCFAGTPDWAERFLELGFYCGVTGMITFRRADNIRAAIRRVPKDRLLLETDAPYLAPVPFRGRENHPGYLPLVVEAVSQLWECPITEVLKTTCANAQNFYRISDEQVTEN